MPSARPRTARHARCRCPSSFSKRFRAVYESRGSIRIIKSRDLWLSNAQCLNDSEELNYGRKLVGEILEEMGADAANDTPRRDQLLEVQELMRKRGLNQQAYVCCFCEQDNLLSQWRGYGENGNGVCIEFEPTHFERLNVDRDNGGLIRLWKVFYDRDDQRTIVRGCVDFAFSKYITADVSTRIRLAFDALMFFIPTFKNADFADERERRLIFTPTDALISTMQFRVRGSAIIPYFNLQKLHRRSDNAPDFILPIAKVQIGPGPSRDLNVQTLQLLLNSVGLSDVPVTASKTPYRS